MKNTKLYLGLGVATLLAGGVYWFVKGRRDAASGPLITEGALKTVAGHRYRSTYLHSKETGEVLRNSLALMQTSDATISVEKPSDTKTVVEGTTKPGMEVTMIIPSETAGIRLVSAQEVPVSLSGYLAGI